MANKNSENQNKKPDVTTQSASANILIVTVTKTEAQAVHKVFSKSPEKNWVRETIKNKIYYDLGIHNSVQVFMVQSEMGIATLGGAISTVGQAIEDLKPQTVIWCGTAFGTNSKKQEIGEILVSHQIAYYESQKVDSQRRPISRGDRVTASGRLIARFRSGDNDWKGVKIHFGLILSGEKLVDDLAFCNRLLQNEPEAIGIETEGAGLYVAARNENVDWILVKSIRGFADENKNSGAESLAANNAAEFVSHVLLQTGELSRYEEEEKPIPEQPQNEVSKKSPPISVGIIISVCVLALALAFLAGTLWSNRTTPTKVYSYNIGDLVDSQSWAVEKWVAGSTSLTPLQSRIESEDINGEVAKTITVDNVVLASEQSTDTGYNIPKESLQFVWSNPMKSIPFNGMIAQVYLEPIPTDRDDRVFCFFFMNYNDVEYVSSDHYIAPGQWNNIVWDLTGIPNSSGPAYRLSEYLLSGAVSENNLGWYTTVKWIGIRCNISASKAYSGKIKGTEYRGKVKLGRVWSLPANYPTLVKP
jgi:nucleoside phosphorylase